MNLAADTSRTLLTFTAFTPQAAINSGVHAITWAGVEGRGGHRGGRAGVSESEGEQQAEAGGSCMGLGGEIALPAQGRGVSKPIDRGEEGMALTGSAQGRSENCVREPLVLVPPPFSQKPVIR